MGFDGALNIVFWIGLAVFILFGVVLPLLIFGGAALERRHVTTLRPFTETEQQAHTLPPTVLGAIAQDDRPLGVHGHCGSGKKVSPVFMLLSGDGLILVRVHLRNERKYRQYELMSRLHSGAWLVTSDVLLIGDFSGARWNEWLPDAPLTMGLQYHRRRIRQAGQPCVPFAAESALAELSEHERQWVARLAERGIARYVGAARDKWVFTIRGAAKQAWYATRISTMAAEGKKRVDAMKEETSLPLMKA